jgi:diguanylate cyclase (GGDEF)-like protein
MWRRTTISGDIHSRPHMHSPPWLTTAWHWFAGSSPDLRRHVLFCLGSLQLYLVSLGVLWHGVYLGLMPREVAQQISIPIVCTWGAAFLLIRSGWSRRCADPVLTLPHAMASTLVTVLAYLLIGEYRGDVLVLLAQTIAVTMFRISPKQSLFLGCWAVGCLSVAQLGLALGLFGQVDPVLIGAHFVVSTSSLLALALVAKWVSDIRLKITRQARKLEETLAQVQSMATTDMLTGLLNRRQMEEVLEAEMGQAQRQGHGLCVAMIDLDHFKRVNDVHGHRMGDEVLRRFAELLKREGRQVDRCGRWGGEEFLLLMPHANLPQARLALERIRKRLSDLPMREHDTLRVTLSAGVAQWVPGESVDGWLERADHAMYEAKHSGRNRVLTASSESGFAATELSHG